VRKLLQTAKVLRKRTKSSVSCPFAFLLFPFAFARGRLFHEKIGWTFGRVVRILHDSRGDLSGRIDQMIWRIVRREVSVGRVKARFVASTMAGVSAQSVSTARFRVRFTVDDRAVMVTIVLTSFRAVGQQSTRLANRERPSLPKEVRAAHSSDVVSGRVDCTEWLNGYGSWSNGVRRALAANDFGICRAHNQRRPKQASGQSPDNFRDHTLRPQNLASPDTTNRPTELFIGQPARKILKIHRIRTTPTTIRTHRPCRIVIIAINYHAIGCWGETARVETV